MESLVYLVDDDAGMLRAMSRLLCACGYRVRAFESPFEFLRHHDPDEPGCVVADVVMPELDGVELPGALKSQGCERPFIFVTGEVDFALATRALHLDAVAILAKPVEESSLCEAINRAIEIDLRRRRQPRAVAGSD